MHGACMYPSNILPGPAHRSDCKDPTTSVIIQVTDDCPCKYPTNAYSNK